MRACLGRSGLRYKREMFVLVLTLIGTLCWGVCFWWMHRISSRQDSMLLELHEVASRIERLSQAEHDLIREVHPKINKIKDQMDTVADKVSENEAS